MVIEQDTGLEVIMEQQVVIAFYNIGWMSTRLNNLKKHSATLNEDLREAIDDMDADVICLCECGEIGIGLDPTKWLEAIRNICGMGFAIFQHSHYTVIVKMETMEIVQKPTLRGPMTPAQGHEYRKCQHLQVKVKDSAANPIDIFNVHSPASSKRPLNATVREQILTWFRTNMSSQTLIGGDLNSSKFSLDAVLKRSGVHYLFEVNAKHGDLVVCKGLHAESLACEISRTSDAHKMCVVMVTQKLAAKPAQQQSSSAASAAHPAQQQSVAQSSSAAQLAQEQRLSLMPNLAVQPEYSFVHALFPYPGSPDEQFLFQQLVDSIWKDGGPGMPPGLSAGNPEAVKPRLDEMLKTALTVREKYHVKLENLGEFEDQNVLRDLNNDEARLVHNAFMNDCEAWMTPECLNDYNRLLAENEQLQNEKPAKGNKNKGCSSRAKGTSKGKGPGQEAQQLKKQRFNKHMSDIAGNKNFFMSFVRCPSMLTLEGILQILKEFVEAKQCPEYERMLDVSKKKSEELRDLKRKRDQARVLCKRGKRDLDSRKHTTLAQMYESGKLIDDKLEAEKAYGDRATHGQGLALFLGPRMGE